MINNIFDDIEGAMNIDWDYWYNPEKDHTKYVKTLLEWIPKRLEYCDQYFDAFSS